MRTEMSSAGSCLQLEAGDQDPWSAEADAGAADVGASLARSLFADEGRNDANQSVAGSARPDDRSCTLKPVIRAAFF